MTCTGWRVKPLSLGCDIRTQGNRRRFVVATTYAEAVEVAAAFRPLALRAFHPDYLGMVDGVLLTGGGDLSAEFTGVPTPDATISDDQRSASDLAL